LLPAVVHILFFLLRLSRAHLPREQEWHSPARLLLHNPAALFLFPARPVAGKGRLRFVHSPAWALSATCRQSQLISSACCRVLCAYDRIYLAKIQHLLSYFMQVNEMI